MKEFLKTLLVKPYTKHINYYGDVQDTPPLWVRLLMIIACTAGAVFTLVYIFPAGYIVPSILTVGLLIIMSYIILIVPRAGQTAIAAVLYWAMLGAFALLLPM